MGGAVKYRVTGIAVLFGCQLFSAGASADDPGERAAAEVLFEAGREAMADGDYDEACSKFEASMALDSAPGTLMNLGNCEEQRGKIASAWERYVAAQRELPSSDRRRGFAASKAKELEARVPRLTIQLADGAPESTLIRRNETDLTGSVGIPLPLDPGAYQVTASAEGFEDRVFDVAIALGETLTIEVGPGDKLPEPVANSPQPVTAEAHAGLLDQRTLAYVVGGIGVVGIAAALTTGAFAYAEKQTMQDECDSTTLRCSPAGLEARDDGASFALISNISGAVGVVALGTGVYLYLTSDDPSADSNTRASQSVKVEAGTFSGYHGLRVSGQF